MYFLEVKYIFILFRTIQIFLFIIFHLENSLDCLVCTVNMRGFHVIFCKNKITDIKCISQIILGSITKFDIDTMNQSTILSGQDCTHHLYQLACSLLLYFFLAFSFLPLNFTRIFQFLVYQWQSSSVKVHIPRA